MRKIICSYLLGLFILIANSGLAQFFADDDNTLEVNGFVFEDVNKNRVFDNFERGIADVLVSNGFDVTKTDKDGKYSLDVYDGNNMVFVIKPSGWMTFVNYLNLPQFYHFFDFNITSEPNFPGAKPESPIPESVDFPLYKTEIKDDFEFIALADPQCREIIELYYFRDDIISELINNEASFAITLGDIAYDDLSLYGRHNEIVSKIGIPVYNVPGNHDMDYDALDDKDALNTYMSVYGPSYYAFEYGKTSFIVIDDVEWMGKDNDGKGSYRGYIGRDQLQWISNYLRYVPTDNLLVLLMHIPLYYFGSPDAAVNVVDRAELFKVLDGYKNILVLAGHMHMIEHAFIGEDLGWHGENEIHQITCSAASGSWWTGPKDERGIPEALQRDGSPNGYHVFSVEGNRFQEYLKSAALDKKEQMRIIYPTEMLCRAEIDTMRIVVNVFNGSSKSLVEYSIDGEKQQRMELTFMKDKYTEHAFDHEGSEYPERLRALPSSHLWTAPFPVNISDGEHEILIRTVDCYGNEYNKSMAFELQ